MISTACDGCECLMRCTGHILRALIDACTVRLPLPRYSEKQVGYMATALLLSEVRRAGWGMGPDCAWLNARSVHAASFATRCGAPY